MKNIIEILLIGIGIIFVGIYVVSRIVEFFRIKRLKGKIE